MQDKEKQYSESDVQALLQKNNATLMEKIELQRQTIDTQSAQLMRISGEVAEYKAKDSSISIAIVSAVEKAQQIENSSKKLYQLEIERIRLLYRKMSDVIRQLYEKYPEVKADNSLNDVMKKFDILVAASIKSPIIEPNNESLMSVAYRNASVKEDPIKKLLNRITSLYEKDNAKVHIDRSDKTVALPESKFDLREALSPKEQLADIMKAFNLDGDKK